MLRRRNYIEHPRIWSKIKYYFEIGSKQNQNNTISTIFILNSLILIAKSMVTFIVSLLQ